LLIDAHNTTTSGKIDANFTVTVDGSPSMYNQVSDDVETAFVIPLLPSSKVVEISSTRAMSEFSILQASQRGQNSPAS
jgi:hypothetical protein